MKRPLFIFGIAIAILAVGFSGCGGGGIPTVEVTGPIDQTITFQNGEVTLAGTLDLPAGEGPFPAIVTVHGSPPLTRNDMYNLYVSHFFVQHGYAVLRYDKRGTGESTGSYPEVGTETSEVNIDILADDALAGVKFLKNHRLIDPKMIGVSGFSQGGWIAPHAASKSPDVAFVIALSGPTCSVGQEIYYSDLVEGDNGKVKGISLKEASDMARDYTGPHGFIPLTSLQKLYAPSLWLLGAKDSSIPVPLTVEILDSLVTDHGKDFSYIVYPNMEHGWRDADTDQMYPVLYDALNWLNKKFED
ncbi:alpha/beta hydrolase family protein [Chloroflexota bacterium]